MKNINNNNWYSTIVALLLIWFLLVLSIWIFRLILNEMKINRAMWDYMKSFAWAESSQELALLWIKKYWYGYAWEIWDTINDKSVMLSENPLDKSLFHPKRDVKIFYKNDGKVNNYEWTIKALWYDIIPLFYLDETSEYPISNYNLSVLSWDSNNLSWNIVGANSWLSWKWLVTFWEEKKLDWTWQFIYSKKDISTFLSLSNTNYLILNNTSNSWEITYEISTISSSEFFTKPILNIISSWELGDYRQNLSTKLDNNEFLNILRYSIYSN